MSIKGHVFILYDINLSALILVRSTLCYPKGLSLLANLQAIEVSLILKSELLISSVG